MTGMAISGYGQGVYATGQRVRRMANGNWIAEIHLYRPAVVDDLVGGGTRSVERINEWRVMDHLGILRAPGDPCVGLFWSCEADAVVRLLDFWSLQGCSVAPSAVPDMTPATTEPAKPEMWDCTYCHTFNCAESSNCKCCNLRRDAAPPSTSTRVVEPLPSVGTPGHPSPPMSVTSTRAIAENIIFRIRSHPDNPDAVSWVEQEVGRWISAGQASGRAERDEFIKRAFSSVPAGTECKTCGGKEIVIRGHTPQDDNRVVCPICLADMRLRSESAAARAHEEVRELVEALRDLFCGVPGHVGRDHVRTARSILRKHGVEV